MARTQLTPIVPPLSSGASYSPSIPLSANSADVVFAASDVANGNYVAISNGKTLLFVQNADAAPQTITIASVRDPYGRLGDISAYSLAAGEFAMFGPFKTDVWNQPADPGPAGLYINTSDADIKIMVVNTA